MRHKGVPTNSLPERQQLHYSSVAFVTDAWQTNLQQPGDQALVTQHECGFILNKNRKDKSAYSDFPD